MWKLNVCIRIPYQWKWDTYLIFQKNDFEDLKRLQNIENIFVFFYKNFMSKRRISPFSPTPPFLEIIFLHVLMSPFIKFIKGSPPGGGGAFILWASIAIRELYVKFAQSLHKRYRKKSTASCVLIVDSKKLEDCDLQNLF